MWHGAYTVLVMLKSWLLIARQIREFSYDHDLYSSHQGSREVFIPECHIVGLSQKFPWCTKLTLV